VADPETADQREARSPDSSDATSVPPDSGGSRRISYRLAATATSILWAGAAISWVLLYRLIDPEKTLGWDLLTTWRAENAFAHGGEPYAVKAFVYPPSCLVLLRPLAALDHHQLTVGGLVATAVIACASVLVAGVAIGVRWWGPTAATTILLMSLTGAMRGEMPLENVSVLGFLALALFFLFVLRDHWYAAAVVIGLSISIKPLLLAVLIVFLLARRWKAFGVAVAVPALLNAAGIGLVSDPGQVWSKLPSLLNRSGSGVTYNSAWVDVARNLGLPEAATISLRVVTVLLVVAAAWLAWTRFSDARLRIITATSVLLMGAFLAGTLSEYHFMLTLVPLAMTIVIPGSPIRSVTGVIGTAWVMDVLAPPPALLGLGSNANDSAFRAIGMSLLILTVIVVLARRRPHAETPDASLAVAGSTDRSKVEELVGAVPMIIPSGGPSE
jgi:arabinofuranan 3-O-arabinosyltransferase